MKSIRVLLLEFVLLAIFQGVAWAVVAPQEFQLGNPETSPVQTTTSISQHGITWTFAEPVGYGQFVNGDYWVVDPGTGVKITSISPVTSTLGTRVIHGSMVNPSTAMQGYDNSIAYRYDATKNVGKGVSPSTPLVLTGNMSLVSTISYIDYPPNTTNNSYVYTASVLTSLTSPAPSGSFRPGVSGTNKTLHNVNSINRSLLKKLAVPSGQTVTASTLTTYADMFQRVWLDHDPSFVARYMHQASSGMSNYYFARTFAEGAVLLHLNFTDEEKHSLLVNFIQIGIDLYSYLDSGGLGWTPDGGNGNGRKWPILFAGIMLDYAPMKNIGQVSGDYINIGVKNTNGTLTTPPGYKSFGEDGQTFYVDQYVVDITSNSRWIADWRVTGRYLYSDVETHTLTIAVPPEGTIIGPWNPDTRIELVFDGEGDDVLCRPYTSAMIGMPEFGIKYASSPRESDSAWTANYRNIGTGAQAWSGFVLAARMMDAKGLWNHNALFDYVDRYMEISAGRPDPFGYVVTGEFAGYRPTGILGAMWDTYRRLY